MDINTINEMSTEEILEYVKEAHRLEIKRKQLENAEKDLKAKIADCLDVVECYMKAIDAEVIYLNEGGEIIMERKNHYSYIDEEMLKLEGMIPERLWNELCVTETVVKHKFARKGIEKALKMGGKVKTLIESATTVTDRGKLKINIPEELLTVNDSPDGLLNSEVEQSEGDGGNDWN